MGDATLAEKPSLRQLILVPAIITLAVTVIRLVGELQHWSKTFFNPEVGGSGSIVGITWLGPVFGIYFGLKLAAAGRGPKLLWRAIVFSLLGVPMVYGLGYIGSAMHLQNSFQGRLLFVWAAFIVSALVTLPAWPALFRVMVAYAYAARVPVAILMFFAFRGNWGTHYDAAPPDLPATYGLLAKYVWLGLIPQLTLWVGFTVITGMICGSLAAALFLLVRRTQTVP